MSAHYYIYLHCEPYLAAFVQNAFGHPVELDRDSVESRIIREFIRKTPRDATPDTAGKGANLIIRLPYFKEADPRVYNYMGVEAKRMLIESFSQLLQKCMLREIGSLENYCQGTISSLIYAFMEKYGIPDDGKNWYTLTKKYYRLRKKYLKKNIKI
jgi:hypothetical protein